MYATSKKIKNSLSRAREYLTPTEIDKLIAAARHTGRHGQRDATMILLAYRHGLRVSELISLCWTQIDLEQGVYFTLFVVKMVYLLIIRCLARNFAHFGN